MIATSQMWAVREPDVFINLINYRELASYFKISGRQRLGLSTLAPLVLELHRGSTNIRTPPHPWCRQYGLEAAHRATALTSVFSGSSVSSAGPEALLSSLTSLSWRSGWELLPHPRSAAGNGECRRSWNHTSAQSKHSRHHCWHHRQNTSHRAHISSSQASSARSEEGWGWWRKKWKDEMTVSHPKQIHHQQRVACQKMHTQMRGTTPACVYRLGSENRKAGFWKT